MALEEFTGNVKKGKFVDDDVGRNMSASILCLNLVDFAINSSQIVSNLF